MQNIETIIAFQLDKTNKINKLASQRVFDQAGLGITVEQWILLKIIEESAQISQKELANKSLRDPASITRTLDILSKNGFIIREQIPENRRQYNIILTSTGKKFVAKHMKMIKELRVKLIDGFSSAELDTLSSMLKRLQENMA
jgi:DNA-binding MarR family transcriptional regulator